MHSARVRIADLLIYGHKFLGYVFTVLEAFVSVPFLLAEMLKTKKTV